MKYLTILLALVLPLSGQTLTNTTLDGVTNATINGKLDDDVSATHAALNLGTAATADASTTGGAGKVPLLLTGGATINGTLKLGATTASGDAAYFGPAGGGICLENLARFRLLNIAGTGGAQIFYHTDHDVNGGELQIEASNRIALIPGPYGAIQIGIATSSTYNKQFAYLQRRGDSTGSLATTTSLPLYFSGSYWNGSASVVKDGPMIVGNPDGTTGRMFLDFNNPATVPNGGGGSGTETLAMRLSETGLSIPVQTITDTNAVITKPLGDARYSTRPLVSSLSADTAGVTSSVVKVDSGLGVTLVTGVTYEIELMLSVTHAPAGGVRFLQSNAGTLTPVGGMTDRGSGGAVSSRQPWAAGVNVDGIVTEYTFSGTSSSNYIVRGIYTATVGGLLKIQYAQSVSDAGATVLKKGSYIIARPQ